MRGQDKIYVTFGTWYSAPKEGAVEYIRKDVLLETIGTARESAVIQKNFNNRPAEQEARIDAYEYIVRKIESL